MQTKKLLHWLRYQLITRSHSKSYFIMSFFDPYHVSEYTGYYSKKGQVLQKRHVERNPALSLKDKEKAIKILNSFGYKAIPNDYMPLEKYTYFGTRCLNYNDIGNLSVGESFQVKLLNLLSFIPSLDIFRNVSYMNVEEINIDCRLIDCNLISNAPGSASNLKLTIGSGFYQDEVNNIATTTSLFRFNVFPDDEDGKIRIYLIKGTSGQSLTPSLDHAIAGRLTRNYIEGDKNLFNQLLHNDFSDVRFDANVIELTLSSVATQGTEVPLNTFNLMFSVYVEVIYKTYLD